MPSLLQQPHTRPPVGPGIAGQCCAQDTLQPGRLSFAVKTGQGPERPVRPGSSFVPVFTSPWGVCRRRNPGRSSSIRARAGRAAWLKVNRWAREPSDAPGRAGQYGPSCCCALPRSRPGPCRGSESCPQAMHLAHAHAHSRQQPRRPLPATQRGPPGASTMRVTRALHDANASWPCRTPTTPCSGRSLAPQDSSHCCSPGLVGLADATRRTG